MTVLEIDSTPYGSTCKIAVGIADVAKREGIRVLTAFGYSSHPIKELPKDHIKIGGFINKASHILFSRLTGLDGYMSLFATVRLIERIKKEKVDLIHFHTIHGAYLNLPRLFGYIKKNDISVIWTLHDCWNFTGICPHFTMIKCMKWKNGCGSCPQYKEIFTGYLVDNSKYMWRKKRKWFAGINHSAIVSPSIWLSELAKQSFLREYPISIINNGIDLTVFCSYGNCREKLKLPIEKYIIIGVAMGWGERKGLDVFIKLSEILDDQFQIILVGTNNETDRKLPERIISIHRTQNQKELAEYYSASDILINPTREDNYPTVNLEALACGTPVITFATGGSPEMLDEKCGAVISCDDVEALADRIIQEKNAPTFDRYYCRRKAEQYDMNCKFSEYVTLYEKFARKG